MNGTGKRENYFTLLGISPVSYSDSEILRAIQKKGEEWIRKAYGQDVEARQYIEQLTALIDVMSDPDKRTAESEEILKLRQSRREELDFTLSLLAASSAEISDQTFQMLVRRFGSYGFTENDLRDEFRKAAEKNGVVSPTPPKRKESVSSEPENWKDTAPSEPENRKDTAPEEPESREDPVPSEPESRNDTVIPDPFMQAPEAADLAFGFVLKRTVPKKEDTAVSRTAGEIAAEEKAAEERAAEERAAEERAAEERAAEERAAEERAAEEKAAQEKAAAERAAAEKAAAEKAAEAKTVVQIISRTGEKTFGIALGNAFSRVSCVDENGIPFLMKNEEGKYATPAYVRLESPGNVVVGEAAKEGRYIYPDQTISSYIRDVYRDDFAYDFDDARYSPGEILTQVLKKIVDDANESLEMTGMNESGEKVRDVVIAVDPLEMAPVQTGFENDVVKASAVNAGLNVLAVMRSDFAAVIGAGLAEAGEEMNVAVYDLGGTSFSVNLIKVTADGGLRWIGGITNLQLGAKDWEEEIFNYIVEQFSIETGISREDLTESEIRQQLQIQAERAMKMLSAKLKVPIAVNYDGEHVRVLLTREKFEEMTKPLLDLTISSCKDLFRDAEQKGCMVSKILLVGGGSKMPAVRARIQSEFGIETVTDEPEEVISKGAAVFGEHAEDYLKRISF